MVIDIVKAVQSILLGSTSITDITGTRVCSDFLPQGWPTPALVLFSVGEIAQEHLEGPLGLDQSLIRIYSYADSRGKAVELAGETWQLLAGKRGVFDAVHILEVSRRTGIAYAIDTPEEGTDLRRFNAIQDLLVSYHSLCEVSP